MAATITRGTTFTAGQQNITVAQFNPLLTSATIANVDRDNMKATAATVATYGATPQSSPQASELWQDTLHNFLASYLAGAWSPAFAFGRAYTLDANSAGVVAGDMLMPSSTAGNVSVNTYFRASASTRYNWMAVATAAVSPGGTGICIRHGPAKIRSTGTINAGEAILASTTDAVVASAGAAGTGYGLFVVGVALQAAAGGYVWAHLRR